MVFSMEFVPPDNTKYDQPLDLEEEQRKIYAGEVLYRAAKYVMSYLQGYKVEITNDLKANPMWLHIKVYWRKGDVDREIKSFEEIINEIVEARVKEILEKAKEAEYKDYKEEIQIGD